MATTERSYANPPPTGYYDNISPATAPSQVIKGEPYELSFTTILVGFLLLVSLLGCIYWAVTSYGGDTWSTVVFVVACTFGALSAMCLGYLGYTEIKGYKQSSRVMQYGPGEDVFKEQ